MLTCSFQSLLDPPNLPESFLNETFIRAFCPGQKIHRIHQTKSRRLLKVRIWWFFTRRLTDCWNRHLKILVSWKIVVLNADWLFIKFVVTIICWRTGCHCHPVHCTVHVRVCRCHQECRILPSHHLSLRSCHLRPFFIFLNFLINYNDRSDSLVGRIFSVPSAFLFFHRTVNMLPLFLGILPS